MGDLISREALIEALNSNPNIRTMRGGVSGIWINLLDVIGEIERVPAAEPVRPKKCEFCGRGKPIKAFTVLADCGLQYGSSITATFCPVCGAKMDGDEKNV